MDDIFAGLEKFGMKKVAENVPQVFKAEQTKEVVKTEAVVKEFKIEDIIYEKSYVCQVCNFNFKSYAVRHGKTRITSIEFDLRPIYTPIEPLLYDVIICDGCGYTAVSESFNKINRRESDKILKDITPHFVPVPYPKEPTIDEAIDRYKLALLNCVVRESKEGERAYICMKITWLYRIKGNEFINERKFASLTLQGLNNAIEKESMPILGISESAVLYLISAFSTFLGDKTTALKVLSGLITSKSTSNKLKNRARDLKETIMSMTVK